MRKIGSYIRVSTEEQAKIHEGSLVSQRHRVEEYVKARNLIHPGWGEIKGVYIDEAKSGKNTNRPQYQALLRDVERGKVDTVLVTELSRLSRNMRDFCDLWDFLKAHRAQFLSLREQFDSTTAAGEMMIFNLMNFAQFERKQTSERVSANFQARAMRGLYNGGPAPLGYVPDPEKRGCLLIDEKQADQVKRIFSLYNETGSLAVTLDSINSHEGIRTKKRIKKNGEWTGGRLFCLNSLCKVLRNRHYTGEREINKKNRELEKDEITPGKEYKIAQASWPAIISKELFESVQEKMNQSTAKYRIDPRHTFDYFCSSVIHCPDCGKPLVGISGTGRNGVKRSYYAHKSKAKGCRLHSINAEDLHRCVLGRIRKLARDEEFMEHLYREAEVRERELEPHSEKTLVSLREQAKEKRKQIENLLASLENGESGGESQFLQRRIKEREAELLQVENQVEILQSDVTFGRDNLVDAKELFELVRKVDKHFHKLPPVKRRLFIQLFFGRIEAHAPSKAVFRYNRDKGSVQQAAAVFDIGPGSNAKAAGAIAPAGALVFLPSVTRTGGSYRKNNGGEGGIRTLVTD
jgi:site-specific DNA recombinase